MPMRTLQTGLEPSRIVSSRMMAAEISMVAVDVIVALRTPLWLASGWGCRDRRPSKG
jgi:hypothetical protein